MLTRANWHHLLLTAWAVISAARPVRTAAPLATDNYGLYKIGAVAILQLSVRLN